MIDSFILLRERGRVITFNIKINASVQASGRTCFNRINIYKHRGDCDIAGHQAAHGLFGTLEGGFLIIPLLWGWQTVSMKVVHQLSAGLKSEHTSRYYAFLLPLWVWYNYSEVSFRYDFINVFIGFQETGNWNCVLYTWL